MNKKSKRKNNLKESIILLILLILLLISSTYAWFTANQTVTISSIDVTIEASNGLQISTNATDWKAIITKDDITGNAYENNLNLMPTSIAPVSTVGIIDASGYMEMYYGLVTADDSGEYVLTASKVDEDSEEDPARFVAFDIFLKADSETNLQLTNASYVKAHDSADNGIKNASRVGFVVLGNEAAGTATSDIIAINDGADSPVYIWEPNANLHSDAAILHASNTYGKTVANGDILDWYGISGEIETGLALEDTMEEGESFTLVEPDYTTSAGTDGAMTEDGINVFTISAGITKVRVYMWVEGQDIDCEDDASGTSIAYNVQLTVVE